MCRLCAFPAAKWRRCFPASTRSAAAAIVSRCPDFDHIMSKYVARSVGDFSESAAGGGCAAEETPAAADLQNPEEGLPGLSVRSATDVSDGSVWNFAFGANLSEKILTGRRKIQPIVSFPASVRGWELSFDMRGLPFLEPGFGTLRRVEVLDPTPLCHGVCHKLSANDYEQLLLTEGGAGRDDVPGYRAVPVRANLYGSAKYDVEGKYTALANTSIVAMALVSTKDIQRPGNLASERYLRLLSEGAKDYGIDPEYVAFLQAHPRHRKTCASVCCMLLLMVTLLPLALILAPFSFCGMCGRSRKNSEDVGAPPWKLCFGIQSCVGNYLWCCHDWVCSCCRGAFVWGENNSYGKGQDLHKPSQLHERWPHFKAARPRDRFRI